MCWHAARTARQEQRPCHFDLTFEGQVIIKLYTKQQQQQCSLACPPPALLLHANTHCRNATAKALQNPTAAWQRWLVTYNVTYSSRKEADYRRQVWMSNLQRADKLNQLVGPEVAVSVRVEERERVG